MSLPAHEFCHLAGRIHGAALIAQAAGATTVSLDIADVTQFVRAALGHIGVELVDDTQGSPTMAEGG